MTTSSRDQKQGVEADYAPAWLAFRAFSGEIYVLEELIADLLVRSRVGFVRQVVDIGAGDGALTERLVQGGVFGHSLECITLIEPDSKLAALCRQRVDATRSFEQKSVRGPRWNVIQEPLRIACPRIRWGPDTLAVMTHVSYYFTEDDLFCLRDLRRKGTAVLLIEDADDCWVSTVIRGVGNVQHPQLDIYRRTQLLDTLTAASKSIEIELRSLPAHIGMPSEAQLAAMVGFFFFHPSQTRPTLAIERLRQTWLKAQKSPAWSYVTVAAY